MQHTPWIKVSDNAPYFEDENGNSWTPIGQNDAVTWPDFAGLFKQKNIQAVEGHMAFLKAHGITCLRIMLEYCQTENRYLEKPVGNFQPNMVRFWDDFFALCEKYGMRVLLTPFDTFWMAKRWKFHPYNKLNGGPCKTKSQWLTSPDTLKVIKQRFTFAIERWGGSGVLFGWDLWNEIDPVRARKDVEKVIHFINEISTHVRALELEKYGKTHPQTVSVFAPILQKYEMASLVFTHSQLDFSTTHFYHHQSIDSPRNTLHAAVTTGNMVREAMIHLPAHRPFLDSEHGPISYFRKNRTGLPELFDDEYFLHMQWAHVASGGAGGGMRWPYRNPHVLTHGMRSAQLNLSKFVALIDWKNFQRQNLNEEIRVNKSIGITAFACGDAHQAIVWLLRHSRKHSVKKNGNKSKEDLITVFIPNLAAGRYRVHIWDTISGEAGRLELEKKEKDLEVTFSIKTANVALAIARLH